MRKRKSAADYISTGLIKEQCITCLLYTSKIKETNDMENKRWKKAAAKNIMGTGKKKKRWKPIAAVCAAAVVLAVGVGLSLIHILSLLGNLQLI